MRQQRQQSILATFDGRTKTLSAFHETEPASADTIIKAGKMIVSSFPSVFGKMSDEKVRDWLNCFALSVKFKASQGDVFGNERLRFAVLNCIANKHQYGDIQIADILNYDKRIRLYTYREANNGTDFTKRRTHIYDLKSDGWLFTDDDRESVETAERIAKDLGTWGKTGKEAREIMTANRGEFRL